VEAFLYAFAPPQPYGILCDQSDALHTVARERHRSTMLQDAFDAAATIFYGHSTENETLIHRGFAKYNYVVPVVNKTLSDEMKNKSDFLLAAVICLLACEVWRKSLLQSSSLKLSLEHHVQKPNGIDDASQWRPGSLEDSWT
jgi:hypothetical protein